MPDFSRFTEDVAQIITAAMGGLISIMLRREIKGFYNVLWGVAGSAFCGKAVAWLCSGVGMNEDITMFFVSLAGWIGANESMRFFEQQVKSRFGKNDANSDGGSDGRE